MIVGKKLGPSGFQSSIRHYHSVDQRKLLIILFLNQIEFWSICFMRKTNCETILRGGYFHSRESNLFQSIASNAYGTSNNKIIYCLELSISRIECWTQCVLRFVQVHIIYLVTSAKKKFQAMGKEKRTKMAKYVKSETIFGIDKQYFIIFRFLIVKFWFLVFETCFLFMIFI